MADNDRPPPRPSGPKATANRSEPETEVAPLERGVGQMERELESARGRALEAEQRAAKAERATAAFQASLRALEDAPDFETLLGSTLRTIAEHIGGRSATAWLLDAVGRWELTWLFEGVRLVRGSESAHPNATTRMPPPALFQQWVTTTKNGDRLPQMVTVADTPGLDEEQRKCLLSLGTTAFVHLAMVSGDEPVGFFIVRLDSGDHPAPEDLALIQSLADQATLVLRLTRAADDGRRAARARDRERAAEERARMLASATRALREAVESLRTADGVETFLARSLRLMVEQMGGVLGAVWLIDKDESLQLRWLFESGRLLSGEEGALPHAQGPLLPEVYRRWLKDLGVDLCRGEALVISDPGWNEEQRAYLRQQKVTTVILVPMILDLRLVGTFAIGIPSGREVSAEDRQSARDHSHSSRIVGTPIKPCG
jgi:GAF domain-containing protein